MGSSLATVAVGLNDAGLLVGVVAAAGFAWTLFRGNAGAAVTVLRTANEVLAERVKELENRVRLQDQTIGLLRAKTDLTVAIIPISTALEQHEAAAAQRSKAMLAVLDLIAAKLGPEGVAA